MTQPRPALAALILLLFLSTAYGIERDPKVMREFMAASPCPAGPDRGSRTRCFGWQKDHVHALECGGRDSVDNLQWLTVYQHYWKTRVDNAFCRGDRFKMRQ